MGIISDIFEDNRERGFEDIVDGVIKGGSGKSFFVEGPPLIECPLCSAKVISEEELNSHIRNTHSNRYVYVRANGTVISDYDYIEDRLKSLDIVLLGHENVQVHIVVNDCIDKKITCSKNTSLLNFVKGIKSGKIQIKARHLYGEKEFFIYFGNQYTFKSKDIDRSAFENLFTPLNNGEDPDYETYQGKYLKTISNKPEYRYASGFLEYALGFAMAEHANDNAKEHFEKAFELLRPFNTKFALTARRVLALRMNCFRFLKHCKFPSRFALSNQFFNEPEARFDLKAEYEESEVLSEYGVFIDKFTELFINALSAYYRSDFKTLDHLFCILNDTLKNDVKNNRDKLLLLEARKAKKQGDSRRAISIYQELRYHPFFKDEAEEILQELLHE